MDSRLPRRSLMQASAATLLAAGLTGCIPTLGAHKRPVVNVGIITYQNGFQPSFIPLYKAALAVTKEHAADYDINVNTITVTPPTPSASPPKAVSAKPGQMQEPQTVSALEQALGQDNPPDVVLFDSGIEFGFALQKSLLQPIDSYLRADSTFKESDYFTGAIAAASDQGELYGLPLSVQPMVLQYDKRLFDAVHLDPPSSSWTWTTFLNAAKALTKSDADNGGQYGVAMTGSNILDIFIWQNGGSLVSPDGRRSLIDDAPAVEAIKFVYDLYNTNKVVAMPRQNSRGPGGVSISKPSFRPGDYPPMMGPGGQRVAMSFTSYGGGFRGYSSKNGEHPIKLAEMFRGKVQATSMYLNGLLGVTQKATDPNSAYKVMALLALSMEKEMTVPAYRPAAQDLAKNNPSIPEDDAKVLVASLEYARTEPIMVQPIIDSLLNQSVMQPIQAAEKTPQEIAKAASQALDLALNQ